MVVKSKLKICFFNNPILKTTKNSIQNKHNKQTQNEIKKHYTLSNYYSWFKIKYKLNTNINVDRNLMNKNEKV